MAGENPATRYSSLHGMIFVVQGGKRTAAGVWALLAALLGFSQAVSLGKDSCSPWEILD